MASGKPKEARVNKPSSQPFKMHGSELYPFASGTQPLSPGHVTF